VAGTANSDGGRGRSTTPVYEHLGFRVLASDETGPELRSLMDLEASRGLDPASRVAMVAGPLAFAPEALARAGDNRPHGLEQ
jgi:hypothetical protein